MNRYLLLFYCLLTVTVLRSQVPGYSFISFTTANGLADNVVTGIAHDSRGFIWLATREGLSRFDGSRFVNFFSDIGNAASLPSNNLGAVFEYKPDHLLLLSGPVVTLMDTRERTFRPLETMRARRILSVRAAGGGYFCAARDTCFFLDSMLGIRQVLTPPFQRRGLFVEAREIDDARWMVFNSFEFFIYHKNSGRYTPFQLQINLPPEKRMFRFHLFDGNNGCFYFSNYWDGLFLLTPEGKVRQRWDARDVSSGLKANDITFMVPARKGYCWIGTIYGGLYLLDQHSGRLQHFRHDELNPQSIISNQLLNALYDRHGNLWVATSTGVSRLSSNSGAVHYIHPLTEDAQSGMVLVDMVKGADGQIYTGTYAAGNAFSIDPSTGKVLSMDKRRMMPLWNLGLNGGEVIFTGAGLNTLSYHTGTRTYRQHTFLKKYFPSSELVILFYRDRSGDQWYSANNNGGLLRISASGQHYLYQKDGSAGHFSMGYYARCAEDAQGNLWFGVNKSPSLLHWNRQTERFREISLDTVQGLRNADLNGINDMCFDPHGSLWIGYDGTGLVKYQPQFNRATRYMMHDGLPSNYINALQFDDRGRLWIGTFKGLACLVPGESKFTGFSRANGLPADYFSEPCILFDSTLRRLWIGSNMSLLSIDPDQLLQTSSGGLPLYLDEISINGQPRPLLQPDEQLRLEPYENNIRITAVAVDVQSSPEIEYSYLLQHLHTEWTLHGTNREFSFHDLAPGQYTFRLRARHTGSKDWSEMEQPLRFVISQPWYQTSGFRFMIVFLILLAGLAGVRVYLNRKLKAQKRLLEKELAVEQERIRMARELHDGLGSMLSGIKHALNAIGNEAALTPEQQVKFDYTVDKLDESIKDLRAVSHGMFSAELLEQGLEAALSNYCSATSATTGLQVSFECIGLEEVVIPGEQAFQVFRLVQELLQNVVRHANATSAIVQVSYHLGTLVLTVEDNGCGFDVSNLKRVNGIGLKNIESRVKSLKGKLDIQSQAGRGSSVLVEIPL